MLMKFKFYSTQPECLRLHRLSRKSFKKLEVFKKSLLTTNWISECAHWNAFEIRRWHINFAFLREKPTRPPQQGRHRFISLSRAWLLPVFVRLCWGCSLSRRYMDTARSNIVVRETPPRFSREIHAIGAATCSSNVMNGKSFDRDFFSSEL